MLRAYICHPFSDDPISNIANVQRICRHFFKQRVLPIAPHLFLPQFADEATERDLAMACCLELVAASDELIICSDRVTEGMSQEIQHARKLGKPVRSMPFAASLWSNR